MTLALTGVGNGNLPPAAQQAIQNAVAQEVPGVSESPSSLYATPSPASSIHSLQALPSLGYAQCPHPLLSFKTRCLDPLPWETPVKAAGVMGILSLRSMRNGADLSDVNNADLCCASAVADQVSVNPDAPSAAGQQYLGSRSLLQQQGSVGGPSYWTVTIHPSAANARAVEAQVARLAAMPAQQLAGLLQSHGKTRPKPVAAVSHSA